MCGGRAELLDAAIGSSLMVSEVFGVSVWDTSHVILVGDEPSPVYLTGVTSSIVEASGLSLVFPRW